MEIWIATSNSGKFKEFSFLLKEKFSSIHCQTELSFFSPPAEDGKTFLENATKKARALSSVKPNVWVLGEDSGLEVDGLNGLPGIHSARYAGPNARQVENTAKLLKILQLRSPNNRKARFRSTIVVLSPDGGEKSFEGFLNGEIALKQRGQAGFGYDDIFVPEGHTQTLAELGLATKNRLSHRAAAVRAFLDSLNH